MKCFILALVLLIGCTTSVVPLCRHTVLAQHAAASDYGYETETWLIKNPTGSKWKYHAAVRVKVEGEWRWLQQEPTEWYAHNVPPQGELVRKLK